MSLAPNFTLAEFASRDRGLITQVPAEHMANVTELARNLQRLRDRLGMAITITSGYRTRAHNIAVGGVSDSRHRTASAADFVVPRVLNATVYCAIEDLIREGKMKNGGLGYYGEGNNHIHYDTRITATRWTGDGITAPNCPPPQEDDVDEQAREDIAKLRKALTGTNTYLAAVGANAQANAELAEANKQRANWNALKVEYLAAAIREAHGNDEDGEPPDPEAYAKLHAVDVALEKRIEATETAVAETKAKMDAAAEALGGD